MKYYQHDKKTKKNNNNNDKCFKGEYNRLNYQRQLSLLSPLYTLHSLKVINKIFLKEKKPNYNQIKF